MTSLFNRRRKGSAILAILFMQIAFQATFMSQCAEAHLDFWTKIKILALLRMAKKISVVPIPLPVPIPIHLEAHDEIVFVKQPMPAYNKHADAAYKSPAPVSVPKGPSYALSASSLVPVHEIPGDHVAYASEPTELIATSSFKYGERIRPGVSSAATSSSPEPRPVSVHVGTSPRPVLRGRTLRNRNRPSIPQSVYQPESPTTTADPVAVDYNALNANDNKNLKIALIPLKQSDIANIESSPIDSDSSAYKPEPAFSEELSKNLIKYLENMSEGTAKNVEDDSKAAPASSGNDSKETGIVKITDVIKAQPEVQTSPVPQRISVPVVTINNPVQTALVNSGSVELGPISSQWSSQLASNLQNTPTFAEYGGSYNLPQTYTSGYKAPELKVITTRYNPKAAMEEQARYAQAAAASSSGSSSTRTSSASPEKSQFLYSVTHDYQQPSSIGNPLFGQASRPASGHFFNNQSPTFPQGFSSRPFVGGFIEPLSSAASIPRVSWALPKSQRSRFLNRLNIF